MHPRQLIRQAVVDLLKGHTAAGDRVYETRVLPLKRLQLPAISVYTLSEDVDDDSITTAPRELTRDLTVVIEGWVTASDSDVNVDDAMDDLASQIETRMHADPYLAGVVGESILAATDTQVGTEGDRLMGLVELTYAVTYRTMAPEPMADAAMVDFMTATVEHNLSGAQATADAAHDVVEVQE